MRATGGEVEWRCALDEKKMTHAFGPAGTALFSNAWLLCHSLATHWSSRGTVEGWEAPYAGATASVSNFTASTLAAELDFALRQRSMLHTLMDAYEIPGQKSTTSIVRRVQSIVRRSVRTKHLVDRFNRTLEISGNESHLVVDFLGQNFACYFLQASQQQRGVDLSAERAYSKMFELQALRRFSESRREAVGLFDHERPEVFELVVVGSKTNVVQRRVIAQIEALADDQDVRVRDLESAEAAAEHVVQMERKAA